jgi:hypothetical protein
MVALHTYVEARLGRWRLWYHWGQSPYPPRLASWYHKMLTEPNVEQIGRPDPSCPVDVEEAEQTHAAVMALDHDLRATVFEAYLKGGTVEQKIKALGVRSRQTYYDRLERAYIKLLGFFNDQAAAVPLSQPDFRPLLMAAKIA